MISGQAEVLVTLGIDHSMGIDLYIQHQGYMAYYREHEFKH